MRVMRLEIEQQRAQIDINIQPAQLHIEMPDRSMEINQKRPEMTARREQAGVELDMEEHKVNMGLKNYKQMTAAATADALASAQQGIREIVSTSKHLGDVTAHGNKVAAVVKDKMLEFSDPKMGHSPIPPGAVEMDGKPGTLEINWSDYDLSIDWSGECVPEISVEPQNSVDVELSTQPSVKMSASEVYIPASTGRNVNTEV